MDVALLSRLRALVDRFAGVSGIASLNFETGARVELNASRAFPTASSVKIFILYELIRRAETGEIDLRERLELRSSCHMGGSGLLSCLADGLTPTLLDCATFMMAISDNTATKMLVTHLGATRINEAIEKAGLRDTQLRGKLDLFELRKDRTALGVSTPADFVCFFGRLWRGELLAPDSVDRFLDVMRIQKYIEPMRRLLPVDPYADEAGESRGTWVASKTGSLSGVRCESGIVCSEGTPWALSVMTEGVADKRSTSDNIGVLFIAEVSRIVFEAWRCRAGIDDGQNGTEDDP